MKVRKKEKKQEKEDAHQEDKRQHKKAKVLILSCRNDSRLITMESKANPSKAKQRARHPALVEKTESFRSGYPGYPWDRK